MNITQFFKETAATFTAPSDQRAQPSGERLSAGYKRFQRRLVSAVGAICIALPLIALAVGLWMRSQGGCFPDSISHFYYQPIMGDIFVMMLAVAAAMLIVFHSDTGLFTWVATLAGGLMLVIALFPTEGSGCLGAGGYLARGFFGNPLTILPPTFKGMTPIWIHTVAATGLMVFFTWVCSRVFTRSLPEDWENGTLKPVKKVRNSIYRVSALVMMGALAYGLWGMLVLKNVGCGGQAYPGCDTWNRNNGTFWVEFFCLIPFGVAWLVKGRLFDKALKS